ncbi:phosphatase [Multifurca ochricompacta]|uniref:Phosphatase n=1 Tax=Multifurca ochricompacta TaxID=376703 RepID=A0AAD4MAJ0_9AGAM|nr:phosphatase [Multifurca ochricompacta]
MPVISLHFDAILFDMDGTLIDSTAGVAGAWEVFAKTYPEINVQEILKTTHGVRTVETLERFCRITDPEKLEREVARFEEEIITTSKENGLPGILLLPGVRNIIDNGSDRWTICTSATRAYGSAALESVDIAPPETIVFAEDVDHGKPMPDPYLLGAYRCGVNPKRCLVVEDAPAGVQSGKAAGCTTLAVVTSHSREQMVTSKADYLVDNLASVTMEPDEKGVVVTITTP